MINGIVSLVLFVLFLETVISSQNSDHGHWNQTAYIHKVFKVADKNNNSKIMLNEAKAALNPKVCKETLCDALRPDIEEIFNLVSNGTDKAITVDDLIANWDIVEKKHREHLKETGMDLVRLKNGTKFTSTIRPQLRS